MGWKEDTDSLEIDNGLDMIQNDAYLELDEISNEKKETDQGYDVNLLQMDGTYPTEFDWQCKDLEEELQQPNKMNNGNGLCLKHGVAKKFTNLREALEVVGGCIMQWYNSLCSTPINIPDNTVARTILMNLQEQNGRVLPTKRCITFLVVCWKWVLMIKNWADTLHILSKKT